MYSPLPCHRSQLGNGHIGILMDSHSSSSASGSTYTFRNSTRCSADVGILGQNLKLAECEGLCTASELCHGFSYCDSSAGATGCAVGGATTRCFQYPDMDHCSSAPANAGWTSGAREPVTSTGNAAPGSTNTTIDLRFGSNAMWAVNECGGHGNHHPIDPKLPISPKWSPPFAPGCASTQAAPATACN